MDTIYLLHSEEYRLLQQGFGEWLQTLGYAPVTVTSLPRLLREFLHYQEQCGKPGWYNYRPRMPAPSSSRSK